MKLVETNPGIKVKDIQKELGVTSRTIERYLKTLKDKELIEFRGSSKVGGYYPLYRTYKTEDVGVNVGVNQVMKLVETNPGIKVKDIQKELNVTSRTIERYIKILKEKELIEFRGSPKIGGYFVIKAE